MTSKGLRSVIWSKQPARLLFSSFDSLGPTWQTPRSFRDEPSRSPTRASALLGSSSPPARGLSSVHPRRSRSEAAFSLKSPSRCPALRRIPFCLPLSPRPLLRPQEKHIESCLLLPLHIEGSPCICPAINAGESRLPGHDADALTICLQQAVLGFIPPPAPAPWPGLATVKRPVTPSFCPATPPCLCLCRSLCPECPSRCLRRPRHVWHSSAFLLSPVSVPPVEPALTSVLVHHSQQCDFLRTRMS